MNEETGSTKKQETDAEQGETEGHGLIESLVDQLACHFWHLLAHQILGGGHYLTVEKAIRE